MRPVSSIALVLGMISGLVSLFLFVGLERNQVILLILGSGVFGLAAYSASLLIGPYRMRLLTSSGRAGTIAKRHFAKAKKSIWLTAYDLDEFDKEYMDLLEGAAVRGIDVRRIVDLRDDAPKDFYSWLKPHLNVSRMKHKRLGKGGPVWFDVILIDGSLLMLFLPDNIIDDSKYSHVLLTKNPHLVRIFMEIYKRWWLISPDLDGRAISGSS